ncbi:copper chaperone PCu(A)C [Streptomyces sp. AV19]|uniref:copper chaperone PCu(A)C n=1 Tax=Streptomyces sp. AV19 TaxID=2793068 RepID=UPI0018FECFDE|nr:copper chaperone PCu(A)C [Streptomyces sp. AV19]MBH1935957.1 copper chaperone PCu(A)C [Streptomyces sp. AV19]MDG4536878.1 copper chaperone PCu(A)C [Streptomyces sp. AV19]
MPRTATRTARLAPAICVLAAAALALTGCGGSSKDSTGAKNRTSSSAVSQERLHISGAYIPEPAMGMAGGFMSIENNSSMADRLQSVGADFAEKAQLHETVGNEMHQVSALGIPAHGRLELKHGGNHIMFMGLKKKLKTGDSVVLTLHFADSPDIELNVPVKDKTYQPRKR